MRVKDILQTLKDVRILFGVAIDALFMALLYFFVVFLASKLDEKALALSSQNALLDPAALGETFLADAQSFAIVFIVGIITLVILLFFGGGLSREFLWSLILKRKFNLKRGLKWGVLLFFLLIGSLPLILVLTLVYSIIQALLLNVGPKIAAILSGLVVSFGIAFLFLMLFSIIFSYAKEGKVIRSLLLGLENISKSWKKTWVMTLYCFGAIIFVNLLFFPFNYYYGYVTWSAAMNLLSFLLLLAWMRIFVIRELH